MKTTWKRSGGKGKWIALLMMTMAIAAMAAVAGHGGYDDDDGHRGWAGKYRKHHYHPTPCCYVQPLPPVVVVPAPCCAPAPQNNTATVSTDVAINQGVTLDTPSYHGPWYNGCDCWGPGWGGSSPMDININQMASVNVNNNINQR